ncbi:MAG: DUF3592 domain-containing protein [Anaerolineae bacterium]|jgi:hypothetical protein
MVAPERSCVKTLGGLLLLALGLALGVFVAYSLARDLSLWVLGRQVTGTVDRLWVEQIGDRMEGELEFRYYVEYHFTTSGGQTVRATTRADVREWGALQEGGAVEVVYFPLVPSHNQIEASRFVPVLACAYLPLLVLVWALLGGGWYLFQPGQQRAWWFGERR